jgi:predicted enzyme related to lactoylglutathione lyase
MHRVILFELQTSNILRTKNFYQNVFGWKIEKMNGQNGGGRRNYFGTITDSSRPGTAGELHQYPENSQGQLYACTIEVPDLDKSIRDVRENGGTITMEKDEIPGLGIFAGAKDPEGNRFGLMQARNDLEASMG